jgi:archaellum component FlaC
LEAAFYKETQSFEMFMEFDEYVWEHKLVASLESLGACQVNPITFAHNDGGDSAANALLRILSAQTTTGIKYSRGPCPPALLAKVQAKQQAAALAEASASREFDEKTMAAIKQSLEQQQEVMVKVEGGLQSQAAELNGIKNDVQSQVVKLEGIENGVCNVIPDYQNEIRTLKEALAKKTAACDTIEGKLAHKTRIINQQDTYIATLELEKQIWSRTKLELQNKYSLMQEEFNMARTLGKMIETLSATLEEERAAKRQRS